MKRLVLLALMVSVCLAGRTRAREPGRLTRSYVFKPKAGQSRQFEDAVKKHLQWAKDNGGTWNWSAYQVATGDRLGSYVFVTHGHSWNDFDQASEYGRKAGEHWRNTVSPHVESREAGIHS